jgi:simple sugar transport system permease protein
MKSKDTNAMNGSRSEKNPEIKTHIGKWAKIEGLPIILVFLGLIGIFMIAAPKTFLNYYIYMSFLSTIPPPLILGLGLTLVIAGGEIDLSFPSIIAFSGFIFAYLFKNYQWTWAAFGLAILGGIIVGLINGLIITKIGMPSIIATLSTGFFWTGLTVVFSGGLSYNIVELEKLNIYEFFVYRIGGIFPVQSLWALGIGVILWFILNKNAFGEHILFMGDNLQVAKVVGINVDRTKIILFVLMGALSAFAGLLLTIEHTTFWTTQGSGFLLIVMAAVFIGGTSIFGGQGIIVGTIFGSFIVGSIEAGIVATGIQGFYTRLVVGLVLLVAISFHIFMEKPDKRAILASLLQFNK